MAKGLALFAIFLCTACAHTVDSHCVMDRPIYFTADDVIRLTIESALLRDIIVHNERWEVACG